VTALTRSVLVAAVALVVLVASAPTVLKHVPDPRDALGGGSRGSAGQSAAQISSGEFSGVRAGSTPSGLRALVGEPASESSTEVEGVRLECWYYGVVGSSGAYQFCFANGKLSTKLRYDRGRP
jgi:hypothetical protein